MKKHFLFLAVVLMMAVVFSTVSAAEETNAIYGETYLCGDAYTARIVTQPQMMAKIGEKIQHYVYVYNPQTNSYSQFQINVQFGAQTEEDVMLMIRLQLRNLNAHTVQGLSPRSFVLSGKVRDRIIEYEPEVMIPFIMEDDDWRLPMIRQGVEAFRLNRTTPDTITYDINQYWNPWLMSEKNIDSMRVWEIRLVYRVPSWLVGWDLHINPQPMVDDEELKTCDLTLHLPTIINEITRETYKYIN